jgi:hypothetical protein
MSTLTFNVTKNSSATYTLSVSRGSTTHSVTFSTPSSTSIFNQLSTGSYIYPKFEFVNVYNGVPSIVASVSYADLLDARGSANINANLVVNNSSIFSVGIPFWCSYSNNHTNTTNWISTTTNTSYSFTYYVPSANIPLYGVHIISGYVGSGFKNFTLNAISFLATNNPNDIYIVTPDLYSETLSSAPSSLNLTVNPYQFFGATYIYAETLKNNSATLNSTVLSFNAASAEPSALVISNMSIGATTNFDTIIDAMTSQLYAGVSANTISGFSVVSVVPTPIVPTPAGSWS